LKLSLFCRGILYKKKIFLIELFYFEAVVLMIQFLFSVVWSWSHKQLLLVETIFGEFHLSGFSLKAMVRWQSSSCERVFVCSNDWRKEGRSLLLTLSMEKGVREWVKKIVFPTKIIYKPLSRSRAKMVWERGRKKIFWNSSNSTSTVSRLQTPRKSAVLSKQYR